MVWGFQDNSLIRINMNKQAYPSLQSTKRVEIYPIHCGEQLVEPHGFWILYLPAQIYENTATHDSTMKHHEITSQNPKRTPLISNV